MWKKNEQMTEARNTSFLLIKYALHKSTDRIRAGKKQTNKHTSVLLLLFYFPTFISFLTNPEFAFLGIL